MNKISTLLLDVDGVIVEADGLTKNLERDFGLTKEDTKGFFKGIFRECSLGKADLKEAIAPFLRQWGWQKSVEDFLAYWFTNDKVDQRVLDHVQQLRSQGIQCYLATVQEKYRSEYLWETRGFKNFFAGNFVSWQLGLFKEDPNFFRDVLQKLQQPPETVGYFDDREPCIASAASLEIQAKLYTDYESFVRDVEKLTASI